MATKNQRLNSPKMPPKPLEDYNLALPPYTVREMEQANATIHKWHSDGAILSATPVDALNISIFQTLATSRRLLDDLADPKAQPMHPDRKQKFLNTFRDVLAMHAASGLDLVGLRAMGAVVTLEIRERGEENETSMEWAKLMTRLDEKEELMRVLAERVAELEADEKEKTE
jgi:hypothetical protein